MPSRDGMITRVSNFRGKRANRLADSRIVARIVVPSQLLSQIMEARCLEAMGALHCLACFPPGAASTSEG
jgi:hypothetical protein